MSSTHANHDADEEEYLRLPKARRLDNAEAKLLSKGSEIEGGTLEDGRGEGAVNFFLIRSRLYSLNVYPNHEPILGFRPDMIYFNGKEKK